MDTTSLYTSLDESCREIRLVTLLPCENDEGQISCLLETASLAKGLEYAAMSYEWGDAAVTTEILVNGIALPATTNLVSALLHFRRYGLGLHGKEDSAGLPRLWIDAICINQQDTAERNRQVARMGEIYASARYVLTWLGLPGEDMIDKSLRVMRSFSQALPGRLKRAVIHLLDDLAEEDEKAEEGESGNERREFEVEGAVETALIQEGLKWISEHPELHAGLRTEDEPFNENWFSFIALVSLSYWRRVWIQQERALCRSFAANLVRCGTEAVTFEDLALFFTFVYLLDRREIKPPEINQIQWDFTLKAFSVPIVRTVAVLRVRWKSAVSAPGTVLFMAKECKATDPRDMVYGMRSLLNLNVDVDYNKTVREVYLDWHAEAVEDCRARGEVVEACGIDRAGHGLSRENPHDLPSWMPDLAIFSDQRWVTGSQESLELGPGGRFQLVGAEGQQYSEDGVLSVYGAVYDCVCRTSLVWTDQDDEREAVRQLAIDLVLNLKMKDHPTGCRPLQALLYTIYHGIDPSTGKPFPPRLDPTSSSVYMFIGAIGNDQTTDRTQDWDHVDLEAAGGIGKYLYSQFYDADEPPRLLSLDEFKMASHLFQNNYRRYLENKAIFYTTDGYIGIGPKYMQDGDQLCIINNCDVPVLLRAERSGHVLVGAVYVYGLCENEPLDLLESGKVTLTKFEIH